MLTIQTAISCNLDPNILLAALPLFEAEKVEAIEWSFDTLYKIKEIPVWFLELLQTYSSANRLIGHGVYFSLFSGKWSQAQQEWLLQLQQLSKQFKFEHITEHFGFMTGENFHTGAPLSVPFTTKTLVLGQDRIKRISNACNCAVGLENLAFAYTNDDVKKHGDFLAKLVEPVNGFIILDLHNLYCQLHNFNINYDDIIKNYPLELVREIHVSGGSWQDSVTDPGKQIRRDTHDDAVPDEVFQLLQQTIPKCLNLKYVVLEQLGNALDTPGKRTMFQNDYNKLHQIIQSIKEVNHVINNFLPSTITIDINPVEDEALFKQQNQLSSILESASSYEHALQLLHQSGFSNTDWQIENWKQYMLETAIGIAQKWKHGFVND